MTSVASWHLWIRDASLVRVQPLRLFNKAKFIIRSDRPGVWGVDGIRRDSRAGAALTPGSGLILVQVMDDGTARTVMSGYLDWPHRLRNTTDNVFDAKGPDDLQLVWDRLAHPSPADLDIATQESDHRVGVAETVIKGYVDANLGPSANSTRRHAGLTIAADAGRGLAVEESARFRPLSELLPPLCLAGGDLGMQVRQTGTDLVFDITEPTDRTVGDAPVVFAFERHNLASLEYDEKAPTANYAWVLGQGEGTARVGVGAGDSDSIVKWGRRIETIVDRRDTPDADILTQTLYATLAEQAEQSTLEVEPILAGAHQAEYGIDYVEGDVVAAIVDGVRVALKVREVEVTIQPGKLVQVRPLLAAPNTPNPRNALDLFRRTRNLESRVNRQEAQ